MKGPSVEPFNEAKYKALMDGLDFQEIYKNSLENEFTIGAEYYGKKYVEAIEQVIKVPELERLGDMWELATDGDHGSPNYQESGVMYLLSECVQSGYIEKSKCRYITVEKNRELQRSCLHPGDVVVTKTGVYFGKSAVIPDSISEANTIAHVGKITLKSRYNPYYVSTFFNCKYGYYQLRRRGIKATRPEIKLVEFPDIIIPQFSVNLYTTIERTIRQANRLIENATGLYNGTIQQLMTFLHIDAKNIKKSEMSVVNLSESLNLTGRLDAEYYQPKYYKLLESLNENKTMPLSGENGLVTYRKSIEPGSEAYLEEGIPFIRVSDVDKFGISSPPIMVSRDVVPNIQDLYPKKDTILLSKDGSIGIAYKLEKDMEAVTSGALLHLTVKDSNVVLPDYLTLVLNSPIVQLQAERDCNGAIIQHWKPSDIEKVLIPVLEMHLQQEIANKVQESFRLRHESKRLLDLAVKTVEMAIETDEETALIWLEAQK